MLREVISNDWLTVFLVLGLGLVTTAKLLFSTRFMDFLGLVGNSKYLKIYSRDQKFIDFFDGLLFSNLVISASIFSFISYKTLKTDITFELIVFLKLLFAVAVVVLIKVLLERLLGSLFSIDELIDSYLFQKTSYKNYTGFILLPINALLLYTFTPNRIILFVVFGLIILINFIGFITSFKNYQKLVISNLFYFILYLCALEIGPYVILYKVFMEYNP